jgi:hypothetical protein
VSWYLLYLVLIVGLLAGMWHMHQHEKTMEDVGGNRGTNSMRGVQEEAEKLASTE